jgi:ribosomal protein S18 acetylase RimI-like enzyme
MTTKWAGNGESLTGTPKVWASTMVVGLTTMATWPGPRGSGLENTRSPGCTATALAAARPTGLTPSAIWPRPTVHGLPIQTVAFLGFVSFGSSHDSDNDRRTGEIYSLYVHPPCWSRGIVAALMARAVGDLRSHGYTSATLWVLAANRRSRLFYEHFGWKSDGNTRTETVGGINLVEVRYRLSPH